MIPVGQDKISICKAGTDLTLQLHEEIKFHTGKVGSFPPGICLDLCTFYFNFSLQACQFMKTHRFTKS